MAATKPKARPDLDVVERDGEAVVYDASRNALHHLNHSAALVFGLCDGTTTIAEMTAAIADVYRQAQDEVESQTRRLIRELRTLRLLEPSRTKRADPTDIGKPEDRRAKARIQVPKST